MGACGDAGHVPAVWVGTHVAQAERVRIKTTIYHEPRSLRGYPGHAGAGLRMDKRCRSENCVEPTVRINWSLAGHGLTPREVREGAVGLGHLVGVFFFLDGRTLVVVGVDDLGAQ